METEPQQSPRTFRMELSTGNRKGWIQAAGIIYVILGVAMTGLLFYVELYLFAVVYLVMYGGVGAAVLYFVNNSGASVLEMNSEGISVNSVSNKFNLKWNELAEVNEVGTTLQFRKKSGGVRILSTKNMENHEIGGILDYIKNTAPALGASLGSRDLFAENAAGGDESFEETF